MLAQYVLIRNKLFESLLDRLAVYIPFCLIKPLAFKLNCVHIIHRRSLYAIT